MKLYSPSTIRDIKEKYGFKLSKSLGQNFLTDKSIIDTIIAASDITDEDLVIEIGPGIGVLTAEAAQRAKSVVAIEIDKNLIPILDKTLASYNNVEIVNKDVLQTNINAIIEEKGCKHVRLIGNLPYYITTPIIMNILERGVKADSITIMMQKEVAQRIEATPGTKAFGALTVAVQYYCRVQSVATVPKEVFFPIPKVDSEVLRLDVRENKAVMVDDESMLFACVKAGFGQRRKTLFNSLTGTGRTKEQVRMHLENIGIDGMRRAETLTIEEFAQIANEFSKGEEEIYE